MRKLLLAPILLLTACANTAPSGTDAACDALRPVLPTYSTQDTQQTLVDGVRFLDVFEEVCG